LLAADLAQGILEIALQITQQRHGLLLPDAQGLLRRAAVDARFDFEQLGDALQRLLGERRTIGLIDLIDGDVLESVCKLGGYRRPALNCVAVSRPGSVRPLAAV
jgi:hypothetical protein